MASKNIKEANKYIAELRSKVLDYKKFTKEKVPPLFREGQRGRKPPKDFVDSSFLYIRSYDGDSGIRPFSNIVFWHSPDITVAPIDDLNAYTNQLDAGKTYQMSCTIRNRGDLIVPSANVEFFLCNPTLGFDTRFATKLGVTAGWVNPYNSNRVGIPYTIPSSLSGHKCLFARVFSFSPLDIPFSDFELIPPLDRHVGQLNLNIAPQASSYKFNLVHMPNAIDQIQIIPMKLKEAFMMRHPFTADYKLGKLDIKKFMGKAKIHLTQLHHEVGKRKMDIKRNHIFFESKSKNAVSPEQQKAMAKRIKEVLKIKNTQEDNKKFREVFRSYREMHKNMQQSEFELQIPDLGLNEKEAVAMKIVATNKITGEIKGGITLVVTR